ncbi:hypothetical protein KIH39_00215 [Telmatocola sphagniphila]|uniref:Uncharacterized protein n=1 Tax=Telmatocola sphagniphila TaxID=1123043 RepID=A0A8E6B6V9_9BACT|nr:hypothetical protein [Telmatocola sphagniphila]QVL32379.1 hypothetical protein KIH39_00215 [Telmatocola sphagniphila]
MTGVRLAVPVIGIERTKKPGSRTLPGCICVDQPANHLERQHFRSPRSHDWERRGNRLTT